MAKLPQYPFPQTTLQNGFLQARSEFASSRSTTSRHGRDHFGYGGGRHSPNVNPDWMSSRRCSTRSGSLIPSTSIVARLVAVRPMRSAPLQRKCSDHRGTRGVYRATRVSVSGSKSGDIRALCRVAIGTGVAEIRERCRAAVFPGSKVIDAVEENRCGFRQAAILAPASCLLANSRSEPTGHCESTTFDSTLASYALSLAANQSVVRRGGSSQVSRFPRW